MRWKERRSLLQQTARARAAQRIARRQKDSTVALACAGRATASKYAIPPSSKASKEKFAARSNVPRRSISRSSQIKPSSQVASHYLVYWFCGFRFPHHDGRVPHVRTSVHGPITIFSNAFAPCAAGMHAPAPIFFCPHSKSVGRGCARLFRPMYAGANMGHPSRGSLVALLSSAADPTWFPKPSSRDRAGGKGRIAYCTSNGTSPRVM